MGSLFGGKTQTRENSLSFRRPGVQQEMPWDLAARALMSELLTPQVQNIPAPMGEAISGLRNMIPSMTAEAFGPGRGLAGFGTPVPGGAGLGPGGIPAPGTPLTRDQLGLSTPKVDPSGFLPPTPTIAANLPTLRTSDPKQILRNKLAARAAAGKPTAKLQRRIDRPDTKAVPGYGAR